MIPLEDNQIDDLYNTLYRQLVTTMIAKPEMIDQVNLIIWSAIIWNGLPIGW